MDQKSPEAFRTISEVAEWLGVPTHVLRFWESRFSQVKPVKRAGGRRYYRPTDMELLGGIRKLLHEDGMTIRGVQKLLREQGVKYVAAMSPPLDLSADTRDISPDNVVDLAEAREAAIQEAEEAWAEDADDDLAGDDTDDDDDWASKPPFVPAPGEAPTVAQSYLETGPAQDDAPPEPDLAGAVARVMAEDASAEADEAPPAEGAAAPLDGDDPLLPDPRAMEFLAHEAEPEAHEPEDRAAPAPPPAPPAETDPGDAMSSPEALAFAAHAAEPDPFDAGPPPGAGLPGAAGPEAGEPVAIEPEATGPETIEAETIEAETIEPETIGGDAAEPEDATAQDAPGADATAPQAAPPGSAGPEPAPPGGVRPESLPPGAPRSESLLHEAAAPEPPAPRLAMPAIGPDPDDGAFFPDRPRVLTRLRAARAGGRKPNAATLQALADRLETLAERLRRPPGAGGGL